LGQGVFSAVHSSCHLKFHWNTRNNSPGTETSNTYTYISVHSWGPRVKALPLRVVC